MHDVTQIIDLRQPEPPDYRCSIIAYRDIVQRFEHIEQFLHFHAVVTGEHGFGVGLHRHFAEFRLETGLLEGLPHVTELVGVGQHLNGDRKSVV